MDKLAQRFLSHIKKQSNGCWIWQAYKMKNGYGMFTISDADRTLSHRASWRIFRGPIPQGLFVCHACDVPSCVNPDHLFLGSHLDNMADMKSKRRGCCGERCHSSKLTAEQVKEIRLMKGPRDEIGRVFGVSGSLISYIRRGEIWKEVS